MAGDYAYARQIWPCLLTVTLLAALVVFSWRTRAVPGALPFAAAYLLALIWVAGERAPAAIFGDAYGNEEAVRRVAAEYPATPFIFGSGLGPSDPNLSVFDDWIHEPAYLCGMLAG